MSKSPALPPIHTIRRQRVVLDRDLAALYGVPTYRLNEAIKRNAGRFPPDFRFQLTRGEFACLISQIAISNADIAERQSDASDSSQIAMSSFKHRGAAYCPWAFTEHGALMAATVLNSPRAIRMSLFIIRAFVQMRDELAASALIMKRLAEIDKKLVTHDVILRDVYEKLRPLMAPPPESPRKEIGFHAGLKRP
jgi:hypothetical protein